MSGADLIRCDAIPLDWPAGMQRVAAWLAERGHPHAPQRLTGSAHTAMQAADALGVALGQIAKSIIFRRLPDDTAVLVITSGDRRVDEAKVQAMVCTGRGQSLGRADAAFVKAATGFSIGGVAPVAHTGSPITLLDAALQRFDTLWAAAGHPQGLFALSPAQLAALTGAPWADVVVAVAQT